MKELEEKLIFLLVNSPLNKSEINIFVNKLKKGGLDRCLNKALKIREILNKPDNVIDRDWQKPISNFDLKVIDKVEMLLRKEAGMTVQDAMNELSYELGVKITPSKRSFYDQLLSLCDFVEGSKILSAAHKIRNHFVHDYKKSDWPLKDK